MRDIALVTVIGVLLPIICVRPDIGVLVWSWIGYMNPHRFTWGFAYTLPFAQLVAAATLIGLVLNRERYRLPAKPAVFMLALFIGWMTLTTVFALDQEAAWEQWQKVVKIQLMVFITLLTMRQANRLHALIWVIAASIGFFGVKGGIFTLLTGGNYHVLGPPGSFISGNTEIGLAMIMTLPLMRYLHLNSENKWIRLGLAATMLLTGVAILGTQSRGALLGGAAMALFLWLKSRSKLRLGLALIVAVPLMISYMPQQWFSRMETIQTYEEDASAMQRIFAWRFGFEMGTKRFLGGGFGAFTGENYERFAPDVVSDATAIGIPAELVYQSAHSIYFGVLGQHGVIGLLLFCALGFWTWLSAGRITKLANQRGDLKWAGDMAGMVQVSLVGYAVGGAFLSLEYFDLLYHLVAIVVLIEVVARESLASETESAPTAPLFGSGGSLAAGARRVQ